METELPLDMLLCCFKRWCCSQGGRGGRENRPNNYTTSNGNGWNSNSRNGGGGYRGRNTNYWGNTTRGMCSLHMLRTSLTKLVAHKCHLCNLSCCSQVVAADTRAEEGEGVVGMNLTTQQT